MKAYKLWDTERTEFKCKQFHFHAPSEHTFNTKLYDVEMHIVCGHDKAEGDKEPRNFSVLGFLFREGKSNPFLNALIKNQEVNWSLLDSDGSFGRYFTYNGSLTTPTCDEVVTW
jgi:carbonic anhydrase